MKRDAFEAWSRERFAEVEDALERWVPVEAPAGAFLDIAVANMANAIKEISIQRGYDVSKYVLACFGGAGGQHGAASPMRWA